MSLYFLLVSNTAKLQEAKGYNEYIYVQGIHFTKTDLLFFALNFTWPFQMC
jgi:hypothetical protein